MKSPRAILSATIVIGILSATTFGQDAAFLPVGGTTNGIHIAQFPVTNGDYAKFVKDTGHQPPRYWKSGTFPAGKENHPVLWVSFRDAEAYCAWLGTKDTAHTYRLPTAAEWETAAGPTPDGAEFNFKTKGTTPVDAYPQTKAACGALDMWGNCWEWTSTVITALNGAERGQRVNAIKGGSWYANRRSCLTDFLDEGRSPDGCYNTIGLRVVREERR